MKTIQAELPEQRSEIANIVHAGWIVSGEQATRSQHKFVQMIDAVVMQAGS